jgi:predicted site-specific integrase-resolvase
MLTRSQLQSLLMPRHEVINYLGISHCTLWQWKNRGILKPIIGSRGRAAFYLRTDIEELKESPQFRELTRIGRPPKAVAIK